MRSKNALPCFALGMLAAIVVVGLGVAPALARAGGPAALPASRALASQAVAPQGFGGSSPLVIPAAAFKSTGANPGGFFFYAGGDIEGTGSACLKAPVYLPDGVTVTSVNASIYDAGTGDVVVDLRRVNITSGATNKMASPATVSNSPVI
jgi:hypothetical protein